MLVLSRRCRESIVLPGDGVTIRVLEIRANRVRLGIEAPSGVSVLRGELICDTETGEVQAVAAQGAAAIGSGSLSNGSAGGRSASDRPLRNGPARPRPGAPDGQPPTRPVLAAVGRE
jgi:carbon storage regulator